METINPPSRWVFDYDPGTRTLDRAVIASDSKSSAVTTTAAPVFSPSGDETFYLSGSLFKYKEGYHARFLAAI
jgi:hypothetical protein